MPPLSQHKINIPLILFLFIAFTITPFQDNSSLIEQNSDSSDQVPEEIEIKIKIENPAADSSLQNKQMSEKAKYLLDQGFKEIIFSEKPSIQELGGEKQNIEQKHPPKSKKNDKKTKPSTEQSSIPEENSGRENKIVSSLKVAGEQNIVLEQGTVKDTTDQNNNPINPGQTTLPQINKVFLEQSVQTQECLLTKENMTPKKKTTNLEEDRIPEHTATPKGKDEFNNFTEHIPHELAPNDQTATEPNPRFSSTARGFNKKKEETRSPKHKSTAKAANTKSKEHKKKTTKTQVKDQEPRKKRCQERSPQQHGSDQSSYTGSKIKTHSQSEFEEKYFGESEGLREKASSNERNGELIENDLKQKSLSSKTNDQQLVKRQRNSTQKNLEKKPKTRISQKQQNPKKKLKVEEFQQTKEIKFEKIKINSLPKMSEAEKKAIDWSARYEFESQLDLVDPSQKINKKFQTLKRTEPETSVQIYSINEARSTQIQEIQNQQAQANENQTKDN